MLKPKAKILLTYKLNVEMSLVLWLTFIILLELKINLFGPKS
jgi:hypothetical protein